MFGALPNGWRGNLTKIVRCQACLERQSVVLAFRQSKVFLAYSVKNNLSSEESCEFITGWHDGFADGMAKIFKRMVHEEGLATKCFSDLY